MIAIAVNAATIAVGSLLGLRIKSKLNKSITDSIMVGIGLFTIYIGISGLSADDYTLIYLIAIVIGGVIGTALKTDENVDKLTLKLQNKLTKEDGENRFASGLTGFFVISCVGAYTIVACFHVGLGDNTMLYTKAVMDFVVSMAMASSLGVGVLAAGVPVVIYELILVGFSGFLSSVLSESMIAAFSCVGAILTVAIGTNVVGISKFKVINYLPALVLAPLFVAVAEWL